jgi:hypothetical protein
MTELLEPIVYLNNGWPAMTIAAWSQRAGTDIEKRVMHD